MALDSKGNQAIDFVWGNAPLQPDTDRVETAPELSLPIAAIDFYMSDVAIFTTSGAKSDFKTGDVVVVSGTNSNNDGNYTINSVLESSPTGLTIVAQWRAISPIGTAGYPAVPAGAKVSLSAAGNFGGGAGDKGWSTTTKRRSLKLDPALDGHNVAVEFWNNFPGYTPNAGFVPQELWSWTTPEGSLYNVAFVRDNTYDSPYTQTAQGFIIDINPYVGMEQAKLDELMALVTANALAGQRVPAISYLDSYGNAKSTPEGWIIGADIVPGAYSGQFGFIIQVATAENAFVNSTEYPATGTTIQFGIGAPKSVLWQGVNGTDYSFAVVQGSAYVGNPANFEIHAASYGNSTDMSDLVALANSGNLVGAWIGLGKVDTYNPSNSGDFWYAARNIMKIGYVQQYSDMYGQPIVILQSAEGGGYGGNYYYDYADGDTIVIVK